MEKSKKFVFYVCPECGNVSENDDPHRENLPVQTDVEYHYWCEGEVIKVGAVPFDEDEMDSLMDYYEARMNERAQVLAKQISAPKTLEDAAAASIQEFKRLQMQNGLASYQSAMKSALNQTLPPIAAGPLPAKYISGTSNKQQYDREVEQQMYESTKRAEEYNKPKRWWKK